MEKLLLDVADKQYMRLQKLSEEMINPSILESQEEIIHDLISSSEEYDETKGKIEKCDKEIEEVELEIKKQSELLVSIMSKKKSNKKTAKDSQKVVSDSLKSVIMDVRNQIFGIINMTTDNEVLEVPITAVFDIEQQLESIRDRFQDNGVIAETPEEAESHENKLIAHNEKVMGFLSSVVHKESYSD